ncbi:MAG TPA: XRE family transcriptional regulator [Planctomycetota bacterium]|jgi:ribosome-binding protein aMBF1 (putative translation factor)|nr:XRE family transcriptional regulator [Planctomycetota bacterium]
MAKRKTRNALEILRRDVGDDPEHRAMVEEETLNARVAREIHDRRTAAGLTQRQLADLVGTSQPVIARLEDADYEGHSLTMLRRIAEALRMRVEVRLVPRGGDPPGLARRGSPSPKPRPW